MVLVRFFNKLDDHSKEIYIFFVPLELWSKAYVKISFIIKHRFQVQTTLTIGSKECFKCIIPKTILCLTFSSRIYIPHVTAFSTFLLLSWGVPLNYHDVGFTRNSQLLAKSSLAIAQHKTSCDPLLGPFEMDPSFNMVITTRTTHWNIS